MEVINILHVDDDIPYLTVVKIMLEQPEGALTRKVQAQTSYSYKVIAVNSIDKAEEVLKSQDVDAVLLDISIPGNEDLEHLRSLVKRYPYTPIIIVSGYPPDLDEIAAKTISNGAQDYLYKDTTSRDNLDKTIRYSIDRCRRGAKIVDPPEGIPEKDRAIYDTTRLRELRQMLEAKQIVNDG